MIWSHQGTQIPLEVYHGVPKGWRADEVVAEHARLGGTFDLSGPAATEPGAPAWLPERFEWLQYRQMLYRLGDGIRAGDEACVELAVRYIELRHIGSYSGYVRGKLARRLRQARLTEEQKRRLHGHFVDLVERTERTQEFGAYLKLWRKFLSEEGRRQALAAVGKTRDGTAKAAWLERNLR